MPCISGVGNGAEAMLEGNTAVDVAAHVGNHGVAEIRRINALRQQRKGVEKIQILRVVVEPEHRLHLSAANAEPRVEPIVGERPIERRMPLSQIPEVAVVDLGSDAKLVSDLHRGVGPEVRKRTAALAGVHGQPVVVVGVDESLRGKPVELNRTVKELEFLRLQGRLTYTEAEKGHFDDLSMHAASFVQDHQISRSAKVYGSLN